MVVVHAHQAVGSDIRGPLEHRLGDREEVGRVGRFDVDVQPLLELRQGPLEVGDCFWVFRADDKIE